MPAGAPSGYRPALDGARGVAVLLVLYGHMLRPPFPAGAIGVRLFFVLSGFLITEKLLEARQRRAGGATNLRVELAAFARRRVLRIFPAYYLLLAVLCLTAWPDMQGEIAWHATYLSNLRFAMTGAWSPWFTSHFWSLAVEEQFYLVWPWVMLLLPDRWLRPGLWAVFAAAVLWRLYLALAAPNEAISVWVSLPASVDALAAGGLLALAVRAGRRLRLGLVGLAGAAVMVLVLVAIRQGLLPDRLIWTLFVIGGATVAACAALVLEAHQGEGSLAAGLSVWPLVALGRISYGVYLWHLPVLGAAIWLWPALGPSLAQFALVTALTIAVATASWLLIERPALAHKDGRGRP